MQPNVVDNAERRSVERLLEGIIRNAHYKAHLAAAFLNSCGYRPKKNQARTISTRQEDDSLRQRAEKFLLNLGAAMQILVWERAGLRPELPAELPTAEEAFRKLLPPEAAGDSTNALVEPELSMMVFRTWLERFSHTSRETLNTDVLLPTRSISKDELLDAMADFLWANRHLADAKEVT
jgi:hypothetical protein